MKTELEILKLMESEMPFELSDSVRPYVIEAIEVGQAEGRAEGIHKAVERCAEKYRSRKETPSFGILSILAVESELKTNQL